MHLFAFITSPMGWAVIGIVAVLLFGNRLPKIARSVGSSITEFKKGVNDVVDEVGGVGDTLRQETREITQELKK